MENEENDVSGKYDDIMYMKRPEPRTRPRMPVSARAAQFAPFAALTGFEDCIEEVRRPTSGRVELSDDESRLLDEDCGGLRGEKQRGRPSLFRIGARKEGRTFATSASSIGWTRRIEPSNLPTERACRWLTSWIYAWGTSCIQEGDGVKLAEALLERANVKKTIDLTLKRLKDNAKVQEGDEPFDNPEKLLEEYERLQARLTDLAAQINRTNAQTIFEGEQTLADALGVRRDLQQKITTYSEFYTQLQIPTNRYSRSEVRFVRCMDPKIVQKKIDRCSKEFRELDIRIQQFNWTVDLIEN